MKIKVLVLKEKMDPSAGCMLNYRDVISLERFNDIKKGVKYKDLKDHLSNWRIIDYKYLGKERKENYD